MVQIGPNQREVSLLAVPILGEKLCDVISPVQAARLERETRYHIGLANLTR